MVRKSLIDSGWQFAQKDKEKDGWLPAVVPGHVHLDLEREGVIPDPFQRMFERSVQWVDEKSWSYRTKFNHEIDPESKKTVLLFEGLDTVCTIYFNGKKIGESDNMFIPVEIDVRKHLLDGENELRIDFEPASAVGFERRKTYFAAEGLPETTACFDERPFVRKAQYMYGWDWGPRLVSCGIWKNVSLIDYSNRIVAVQATTSQAEGWVLNLKTETEGKKGLRIVHTLTGEDIDELVIDGDGEYEIEGVEQWDTYNPVLYTLTTELWDGDKLEDFAETAVGFRTIELVRQPDEFGESFHFVLNGEPIWARGANWIPNHSFPSSADEGTPARLADAVDMGMNMIRVWGGGLYESDEFYDTCDRLGLLVWQDFAYGCSYYPDGPEAQQIAEQEALANIKRLRNHPSLALWCGNNENLTMFHSAWGGKENRPPRFYGENLYNAAIPKALAAADPGRPYIDSSPTGGDHANSDGFGDQHYWDVWHGRGDWRHYVDSGARFCSEFGFISSQGLDGWGECLSVGDDGADTPVVRWHDKSGKGYEKYQSMIDLHYPKSRTLHDLVYYTQLNQRDAMRFGIEHYRRSEFCKGTIIWQLNDCWPVQSWALVDSVGQMKAAGHELKRIYMDRLLSVVVGWADAAEDQGGSEGWANRKGAGRKVQSGSAEIWMANDDMATWEGDVVAHVVSLTSGKTLAEFGPFQCKLEPEQRSLVATVDISKLDKNAILFAYASGVEPTWSLLGEPKDTQFGFPDLRVERIDDSTVVVRNAGTIPAVDIWLYNEDARIDPSENFFTLMPQDEITVDLGGPVRGLKMRCLGHPAL